MCSTPAGFSEPCPDIVSFLNNGITNETVTINGVEYTLLLYGFIQNGSLVNQFIMTQEQANSAELFGRLERPDAIPEPLTIFGAGTALGFGTFFKRQLAKKQKKGTFYLYPWNFLPLSDSRSLRPHNSGNLSRVAKGVR